MAGTIRGRIECAIQSGVSANDNVDLFAAIYDFMVNSSGKTLETLQYGSSGLGTGYWDSALPFTTNAFAVFKFPAAGTRTWYWQLMIQFSNAFNFGTAPGDPGLMLAGTNSGTGVSAAVGIDGTSTQFDPWLGGKKTDGKARKVPAWAGGQTYNLGDRVMYQGVGYQSGANGNVGNTPPAAPWAVWRAAPAVWNAATTYGVNDEVYYAATTTTYVSSQASNLNHLPTDTNWWQPLTSIVWGAPPGITGPKVWSLPRSNYFPLGWHGAQKHNCAKVGARASYGARLHIFCDDDAILICIDDNDTGTYEHTYIGPYRPLGGLVVDRPLVMLHCEQNVTLTAADIGDVTGSDTQRQGGVITRAGGVRTAWVDYLTSATNSVFNPTYAFGVPRNPEFLPLVCVNETTPNCGVAGELDSPLLRYLVSSVSWQMNTTKTRIKLPLGSMSSNNTQRLVVPWNGSAAPQTGTARTGINFTIP